MNFGYSTFTLIAESMRSRSEANRHTLLVANNDMPCVFVIDPQAVPANIVLHTRAQARNGFPADRKQRAIVLRKSVGRFGKIARITAMVDEAHAARLPTMLRREPRSFTVLH